MDEVTHRTFVNGEFVAETPVYISGLCDDENEVIVLGFHGAELEPGDIVAGFTLRGGLPSPWNTFRARVVGPLEGHESPRWMFIALGEKNPPDRYWVIEVLP